MSIRADALRWFSSNYGDTKNKIYTSKYYTPEESWPKTHVWWVQISMNAIDSSLFHDVNIICQIAPNKNVFHYLKVPTKYFHEHLKKFHLTGGNISLYLSAASDTLFIEERGEGRLNFSKFLITK
jgi:hypothetical protein